MKPLLPHRPSAFPDAGVGLQALAWLWHRVRRFLAGESDALGVARARQPGRGNWLRPHAYLGTLGMFVAATLSLPAQAVVLGSAAARSHLGQPLVVEIGVLDSDADSLAATLASPEMHQSHGIRAPHYDLGRLNVRVIEKNGGQRVIRVTSERPVHEPIVQLLVDARDGRGHIVRKLTLLVDPTPGLAASPATAAVTAAASDVSPAAAEKRAAPLPRQRATARASSKPRSRARPAAKRAQRSATRTAAKGVAKPAVRAHVGPDAGPAVHGSTAAPDRQTASAAPSSAVASATGVEPTQTDGLPAFPDDAAQALQDAASRPSTDSTELAAAATPSADLVAPAEPSSIDSTVGIGAAQAAAPAPSMPEHAERQASEQSAVGSRISGQMLVAGAVLLLGGLFILLRRRRRAAGSDALDSVLAASESEEISAFGAHVDSTLGDSAFPPTTPRVRVAAAQQPSHDSLAALQADEDVDPVAEADVYIAYGRTDQAKAILQEALHHHPERAALHLKLMTIHRDQSDALAFKERARTLALLTGQSGPSWQEACEIGRKLIPGDSLFIETGHLPLSDHAAPEERQRDGTPASPIVAGPAVGAVPWASLTASDYAELGDTDPGALAFTAPPAESTAGDTVQPAIQVDLELFSAKDGEQSTQAEPPEEETTAQEVPVKDLQ